MGCGGSKAKSNSATGKKTPEPDSKTTETENRKSENDKKQEDDKSNEAVVSFKIILVGDERVGKTCLLTKFVQNEFIDIYLPTLGSESKTKALNIDGNQVKLQILDTSGNERFRQQASSSLKEADGVLIVFDLTNKASLNNTGYWHKMVASYGTENSKIGLVGNKIDCGDREVPHEDAVAVAEILGIDYVETSAKDNVNLEKPFMQICKNLLR